MEVLQNKDVWDNIKVRHLVAGDENDNRLEGELFSDLLSQYRIAHLGVLETGHPYELTRVKQNGSCFIATISGEGRVLLEGEWHVIPEGSACLLPPFVDNSIKTTGDNWTFAWVKYLEHEETRPVGTSLSPVIDEYDSSSFVHACMGLYTSCVAKKDLAIETLWLELIHKHVLSFAHSKVDDGRLWELWQTVEADIERHWSLKEMAAFSNMSGEHLRRLCKREFGRSPMQQLTHIRIRKARFLLATTRLKISAIARGVGYCDEFHFSNVFYKVTGSRPSNYRDRREIGE